MARELLTKEQFNELPNEIIEDVKGTLKAYDECYIIYQNGKYQVTIGLALLAKYPSDFKYIGVVRAKDIYTEEEKIINYIETFHEYPIEYKGTRDYKMLREVSSLPVNERWSVKFKLDENKNIVRI